MESNDTSPSEIRTKSTQKTWFSVLQIFAAYPVAAWTFLQFVEWVLNRYFISPHWVELFLWSFAGIIPSLLIYLYHRERIKEGILCLREKVIFPLNLLMVFLGLYLGFGTTDLGATTKEITITTKAGEKKELTITKEEFRTILPMFNFLSKSNDSSIA